MGEPMLEDLVARLDRERQEADRLYNDALTAVDRAIQVAPEFPAAPPGYDASRLAELNGGWNTLPGGPPHIDRSVKGRLRGFVWRLIGPSLEAQRQFNAVLVDNLNRNALAHEAVPRVMAALIDALRGEFEALARFESLLVQYLQTITIYVDSKDRALAAGDLRRRVALTDERLLALKREVERLRDAAPARAARDEPGPRAEEEPFSGTVDSLTYVGFEDQFRGSRDEIRGRVKDYLPLLESASEVIDVGCGRGELLALLRARGVTARGVDANRAMVDLCRAQGLTVEQSDALSYLQGQADGSIGGLVAVQVVEHFEPAYLTRFLETAFHKMRRGAPLLLETINPACWMAFFECYIRDLTHRRPLHPDTLRYLVQASGFSDADVQFRQPVGEGDRLERVPDREMGPETGDRLPALAAVVNAHADKLNARLFSSMDYVVLARR